MFISQGEAKGLYSMNRFLNSAGKLAFAALTFLFALTPMSAGSPVSGVEVCLESSTGKKITTTTDKDGKYSFENLDKGTYTVKVRCTSGECVAPRDAASGQATGKVAMQDFHFTCTVSPPSTKSSSRSSVSSPRDASSGLATGKRQHKPVTFKKEWSSVSTVTVETDGSSCTGDISGDSN